MKWITKEIVVKKIFTAPVNAADVFKSISDTNEYLVKVLGEPVIELKTDFFEITEDGHCPNKCKNPRVHLRTRYESSDSTRRVLEARCLCCDENYLVYQVLDGE